MKFYIPFSYERYGRMEVEADDLDEAFEIAQDKLNVMGVEEMDEVADYLLSSEQIDYDGEVLDENGNVMNK